MTMIVETVVFDRKLGTLPNPELADRLSKEMNIFSKWLILTARICGLAQVKPSPCFVVKYVADPNMPPIPDENIPRLPHRLPPPEIVPINPFHATLTSQPRRGGFFFATILKSRDLHHLYNSINPLSCQKKIANFARNYKKL